MIKENDPETETKFESEWYLTIFCSLEMICLHSDAIIREDLSFEWLETNYASAQEET